MPADLTPRRTARVIEDLRPVLETLLAQPWIARAGLALSIATESGAMGDFVIGDLSASPYPNAHIARQKRDLSLRCRMAGARVPPQQRIATDSEWTGSAWDDGIAVGCAGLTEAADDMVAHWVARALHAARPGAAV